MSASSMTLAAALWPVASSRAARVARAAALSIAGALALTVSAKTQIPFWPVPLTMQTLVVPLLAAGLGARLSVAAVALYLLEGALGLPVFAGTPERGLGLAYMMGPTGGYLLGFLAASLFIGHCADRGWDRTALRSLAVIGLGHAVIFAAGALWLAPAMGLEKAWIVGVAPFLSTTLVKTLLSVALLAGSWKLVERLRG